LSAHLPSAVRLIMLKADGCVAVHADGGAYKPLNWMNAPNRRVEEPARWVVTNAAGERLEIELEHVLLDVSQELGADPGLTKDGVEANLQELLAASPGAIEAGLVLVRREYPTGVGPVDLLCRDVTDEAPTVLVESDPSPLAGGRYVAIEVKRNATLDAIDQLGRYLEWLNLDSTLNPPVRGVLVALTIPHQVKVHAVARGIRCVKVDYDELRGRESDELRLF
jgi:RecB family endonuclease NucS